MEIVIVNDGSKDKTLQQIVDYSKRYPADKSICVRGLNMVQNQGKGSAVKYVSLFNTLIMPIGKSLL